MASLFLCSCCRHRHVFHSIILLFLALQSTMCSCADPHEPSSIGFDTCCTHSALSFVFLVIPRCIVCHCCICRFGFLVRSVEFSSRTPLSRPLLSSAAAMEGTPGSTAVVPPQNTGEATHTRTHTAPAHPPKSRSNGSMTDRGGRMRSDCPHVDHSVRVWCVQLLLLLRRRTPRRSDGSRSGGRNSSRLCVLSRMHAAAVNHPRTLTRTEL